MSPTIALCMIVKDEEHGIQRAIESAAPWVDEIVVVDTGSTDATMNIVRESGATVDQFQFTDGIDLAAARNHSLKLAHSDWALLLDGDTTLDAESGQYLKPAVAQCSNSPKTILGLWKNPGQTASGEVTAYCRTMVPILNNGQFLGRRHEYFINSDGNILPTVRAPQIRLKHWGIDHNYLRATNRLDKIQKNGDLTLQQVRETPEYSVFWVDAIRGNRYSADRCRLALDLAAQYKAALKHGEIRFVGEEAPFLVAYYEALIALQLDNFNQAATAAASALSSHQSRDMLTVLAATKAEAGKDKAACADILNAGSLGTDPHIYTGLAEGSHVTSKMLTLVAAAAQRTGKQELALNLYRKAMAIFPTYEPGPPAFARFLRSIGHQGAAASLISEALDAFPENGAFANVLVEGWNEAPETKALEYLRTASRRWPQNRVFSELLASH